PPVGVAADRVEILVCDDGSTAVDAAAIQTVCAADARVRYLRQEPRGPAAARNLGVAHARAPVVVFTDSDTLPQPGWLAALVAPFADSAVVAVEGTVQPPGPPRGPLDEAPRSTGGVFLTANMAYLRDALHAVGGFDESFPMPAFEDVDLALAVRDLGRIDYAPGALVLHPWRRVTLGGVLKRQRNFDWLLVTGLRWGCLGWVDRPTRHPRLRVALAAAVTLPLGRMRRGLAALTKTPCDALERIGISLVEAVVGCWRAPRYLCHAYAVPRRRYLPAIATPAGPRRGGQS
ncbi:MAG: glycosyltransferase family 2 protein, partial [Planctomycetia bacterium]